MHGEHNYSANLRWEGEETEGTASYEGYTRGYRVSIEEKPDLLGTADPSFRGDASRHNPEDLLLASISACHMLSYLALCARRGILVLSYRDGATGRMLVDREGGGRFEEVILRPVVTIRGAEKLELARELHERAHKLCFIASSCNFPIRHEATLLPV
jgi:organic hydroperoxide reductase OsmC/OhrA